MTLSISRFSVKSQLSSDIICDGSKHSLDIKVVKISIRYKKHSLQRFKQETSSPFHNFKSISTRHAKYSLMLCW